MSTPATPAPAVNPWVAIALALIPEIAPIWLSVQALLKKYPALTAEQIMAVVTDQTRSADAAFDRVMNRASAQVKSVPPAPPANTPTVQIP